MENPAERLAKKIAWHESEARRLRSALDVLRELEQDDDSVRVAATTSLKFDSTATFAEAVKVILRGGKKTTLEIRNALIAGGFNSNSTNFSAMVQNRLADAARRGQVVKSGGGKGGLTWSLPSS